MAGAVTSRGVAPERWLCRVVGHRWLVWVDNGERRVCGRCHERVPLTSVERSDLLSSVVLAQASEARAERMRLAAQVDLATGFVSGCLDDVARELRS